MPWSAPPSGVRGALGSVLCYHDRILAVRIVDGIEEAMDHIHRYGTKHSEAIVTESYANAQRFLSGVDAAAVYVNASTRFTDGGVFGFGAEMGISTQKLHARGPMGVEQLTSTKCTAAARGRRISVFEQFRATELPEIRGAAYRV